MASTRQLKSRIRSVKNTKQITKAMQMVAASKMRRAQEAERATTPYTKAARELLTYLASQGETNDHPLFVQRPVKSRLMIVIASDKGLAGAYNNNIAKAYVRELREDDAQGIHNETITVGRKASQFVTRLKDTELIGVYDNLPDRLEGNELRIVLETALDKFEKGNVDAVDVIFTDFISSVRQEVRVMRILPAGFEATEVASNVRSAIFEPSPGAVFDGVVSRLIGAQLFQALLDARASEQSMRMMAMKNATDNAEQLADDLTLAMNKARQGAITQELAEISGGVEALKE